MLSADLDDRRVGSGDHEQPAAGEVGRLAAAVRGRVGGRRPSDAAGADDDRRRVHWLQFRCGYQARAPVLRPPDRPGGYALHADLRVPVHRLLRHVRGAGRREQDAVSCPDCGGSTVTRLLSSFATRARMAVAGAAAAGAAAAAAAAATEPSGLTADVRIASDGPARADELDRLSAEWRGCQKCALARTRTQVVVGIGRSRLRPDVRRRGAGLPRGQAGPAVRRSGRQAAGRAARVDRHHPAAGLHRQRPQVPAAGEPRSRSPTRSPPARATCSPRSS